MAPVRGEHRGLWAVMARGKKMHVGWDFSDKATRWRGNDFPMRRRQRQRTAFEKTDTRQRHERMRVEQVTNVHTVSFEE